ncbi:MAG: multicopper oxidase domain-containing protein [Anaerolineae bacterium]|nr:multicopper oxidase domain-containing protein [Anaerolineae bacterium]MCB9101111.1 multicopper oxidase domain-containing protein [Anaerolineales bacterium]
MECTNGPSFDLQATQGYIDTPDGNSVYMWGFALDPGSFQMPGPVLCVDEGDMVTINLTNNLNEPVSIVFPGQMGVTATGGSAGLLATEAAASGGTVSYSFTASEPGTYLYESGTNTHKQVQMGLAGVIVVRPAMGDNYAYNDSATQFDPNREYLLVFHDIDPVLHQAVEFGLPYEITTRHDRYWTINGRGAVDTLLDNNVVWLPHQPYSSLVRVEAGAALPALIRYANAGTVNHPFHPHGNTMQVVGRDGRALEAAALENFTTTIGAGQTNDLLFRWDNVEGWTPGPNGNLPDNPKFPFPNLGNLVFKDDVTFYSGNPYLGQQGSFPPGVTSFNECGEFYFPWHSHALNEIQNFDEGFGGMLTLVRVDPPGGCP